MHINDLCGFLNELSDNNNRAWFVMNKPRYDILREEFLTLTTQLIAQIGQFDALILDCNPKKALFRINRDVRFSHDKSPYKTTFSAAIVPNNLKKPSQGGGPAYYFHINAAGELFFAVGEYMPPADRLKQIRTHIAEHGAGLVKVLKDKKLQATFGGLQDEGKLQRPPKGFDADHPHIEFIKNKNFILWQSMPVSSIKQSATKTQSDEVIHQLASAYKTAYPFARWLRESS